MSKKDLTKKEVVHLSHLAQLQLNDEELEKYKKQLSETLEYVNNLNEIVDGKNDGHSEIREENVFFEDIFSDKRVLTQDQALSNTQNKKDNYFLVDKIL
ncbi:MAG TPA: Asp-tRNA(Asn)/Glu-tRNA(Gln) amidotransferase subunit GatC [Patescibacteria group bacterium]|nr:Asp-tRNA(Asn)/Glu-tRNA(Gln) amidotransferase subunit GatC [Patescibacteria group bacterium]